MFSASAGAKSTLWIRNLDETSARPLSGTEDASRPFWSPDSEWIAFISGQKLKKVPAQGGAVQVIAEGIRDGRGGSWGSDGTILCSSRYNKFLRVPAAGGQFVALSNADESPGGAHRWPQFLPDGRHFLFTLRGESAHRGVYAAALDGQSRKRLLPVESSALYVPPGYLLWVDGDILQGQKFDAGRLELAGQPFTVAERVGRSSTVEGAVSASENGTLAYSGIFSQEGRVAWFDRAGNALGSPAPDGDYVDFRTSPDAKRLAASLVDPRTGTTDVWLTSLDRRNTERLTSRSRINAAALWSPDGARVLFRTNRSGLMELYQKSAFGGDEEAAVLSIEMQRGAGMAAFSLMPTDWSPDGQHVLAHQAGFGSGFDIWLIPIGGTGKPSKFLNSAAESDEMHANFSPDGRLVAYSSNETGRHEIYVQTFPRSDRRWPVSTGGGSEPRWRGDGREIYYLSGDGKLMAAPVSAGPSFGVPKALFQTQVSAGVDNFHTHYVPHPDGQRFLVNTQIAAPSPKPITVVLNWTAGLKK